jgi:hypothetical protein
LGALRFLRSAPPSGGVLRESNPAKRNRDVRGFEMTVSEESRDREVRAARNQSLFREINERVKELNEGFSLVLPTGEWVCECANETCTERVSMSAQEYEEIRSDGVRFFVASSEEHVWPDVELVTKRHDRYWVVEKVGHSGDMARDADPRSEPGA